MELTAHAVVLLLGPDLVRAHSFECLGRLFDRACEHEPNRLEKRHARAFELAKFAPNCSLANVACDQMDALDLRHRQSECFRDCRLHQTLAQADPHLTGDDFDHEAGRFRVQPAQELLQRRRFGFATRGSYRLQCLLDIGQGDVFGVGLTFERLARPVADVGMLSKNGLELVGIAP